MKSSTIPNLLGDEPIKEPLKCEILSYLLMKPNLYYVGILATTLLVLSGPASFATPTDTTQLTESTDQTQTSQEGAITVAIGEGTNGTLQYYTYTPQTVEINAGESVTWITPVDPAVPVDIHTVTFVQDPSIFLDMTAVLPFAIPGDTPDFEVVPPFSVGEPVVIQGPDGRQAIVAANKNAFYPAVLDVNNETTYLEGIDLQATLNSTVRALNSGIILPPVPPMGGAQPNSTETEPTIMTNATDTTTDVLTAPEDQGTPQDTEGSTGEIAMGPPFPVVSSFTVTFEEPGTYAYFCAIHPWMVGEVVVRGDIQTETQPDIQTETQPQNQTQTEGLELESANPIFG